ncbi:hypothetical protein [Phenylobacterium sp. VNQ135]|uniref:hypothetical protein n=1 Tax=Phenylobacterium sp. VNQ135 TaxID=3400922 RepID=UPI003C30A4B9
MRRLGSNAAPGRFQGMPHPHDPSYNRDDEQKPGRPQRTAYEPKGSEGEARTSKTLTDPASGESQGDSHAPNQAEADQTDGVRRRGPPSTQGDGG